MNGREIIAKIRELNAESSEVGLLDNKDIWHEVSGIAWDDDNEKVVIV